MYDVTYNKKRAAAATPVRKRQLLKAPSIIRAPAKASSAEAANYRIVVSVGIGIRPNTFPSSGALLEHDVSAKAQHNIGQADSKKRIVKGGTYNKLMRCNWRVAEYASNIADKGQGVFLS